MFVVCVMCVYCVLCVMDVCVMSVCVCVCVLCVTSRFAVLIWHGKELLAWIEIQGGLTP